MLRQEIEVFAQNTMLLQLVCKQRMDCRTSVPEENFSNIEYTFAPSTYKKQSVQFIVSVFVSYRNRLLF